MMCQCKGFLRDFPGGNVPADCKQVALDFAVINAFGQGHAGTTGGKWLSAAVKYSNRSATHKDTQTKCAAEGIA